ncbi:MAG TPA: response regulator [Acetobacteraceae bacterium]|nr:response regulator [Acetobacteraceae bacterium]
MIMPPSHPGPGPIVIIVAEDESARRMLAAEVLTEAGYTVVEAARADDALAIIKSRAVDLLFTDVQMPGSMDGLELARYVRRHWPRVAVLIASGNNTASTELPDGSRILRKPWRFYASSALARCAA